MGYTRNAIKGVSWTAALSGITKALGLAKIFALASVLSPAQFGVYGIAMLVIVFLETLSETGVNVFLLQEKDNTEAHIDSAWIISMLRGTCIALVMIVTAPYIASFFRSPDAYQLILFSSIIPFTRGFINPAEVTYQKNLLFHKEFYFRTTLLFVDASISLSLAFLTHSVYSIMWGQLGSVIVETILSFFIFSIRPRLRFDKKYLSLIFHSGKWITLAGVFNYFFLNFDDFVVGRILGPLSLGIYQMAYKFSVYPVTEITNIVGKVSFPVYARIADDKDRLKRAFFRTIIFTILTSVLYCVFIWFCIPLVITVVLGEKWAAIIPIVRLLSLVAALRAIYGITTTLFFALKQQKYVTITTIINFAGIAITIVPLVMHYGTTGAVIAVAVGSVIGLLGEMWYIYKAFRL